MGKPEWGDPEFGGRRRGPLRSVLGVLLALVPLLMPAFALLPSDTVDIEGVPGPERYSGPGGYTNYNRDMVEIQRANMKRLAGAAAASKRTQITSGSEASKR